MFKCEFCNKEFNTKRGLSGHITSKHKGMKPSVIIPKCSICGKNAKKKPKGFFNFYLTCGSKDCINKLKLQKSIKTNLKKYGVENPSQSLEIKNKVKQTNLKKYGVEYPSQLQSFKNKVKVTNLKNYGVENPLQSKIIKNKVKKTNLKKYGTEWAISSKTIQNKVKQTLKNKYGENIINVYQTKQIKNKIKQTNLKKYGVEYSLQSEEIKNKIKQTNLKKYGVENPLQSNIIQNKIKQTNLKKYGTEYPAQSNVIKQNNYKKYYNEKILNLKLVKPLFTENKYIGTNNNYQWKCIKCGEKFYDHLNNGHLPRCPKCFPKLIGSSKPEQELQNWIKALNIKSENNKRFKAKELDVYLPEFNLGIEMDGIYWHSELRGKDKNYHINKTNYFKSYNIEVIHIFETEWYDKQEIVKSIIKNKLKLNKSIYARKCELKEVSIKEAKTFLDDNHLQNFNGAKVHLGLYFKNSLVAYMSLGKSRFNKQYQWEMIRFANKIGFNVVGGFSKLLKHFEKNYKGSIISYVDLRYFNGNGYIMNGFEVLRFSSPNYFYMKNYKYLESRQQYQKHKLKDKLKSYNENLTEWENMKNNGYDRIWDCGNLVMIK